MIAGHNVTRDGVGLHIYTRFESARAEQDRQCLADISASGCNRDGLAIRLVADVLSKRPERIKLLIVLSDGTPNDTGYSGAAAAKDVSAAAKECQKKSIIVYGGAIGEDKEAIQAMYGKGFLDITDLNSMPKTLIRLIRNHMLHN